MFPSLMFCFDSKHCIGVIGSEFINNKFFKYAILPVCESHT